MKQAEEIAATTPLTLPQAERLLRQFTKAEIESALPYVAPDSTTHTLEQNLYTALSEVLD